MGAEGATLVWLKKSWQDSVPRFRHGSTSGDYYRPTRFTSSLKSCRPGVDWSTASPVCPLRCLTPWSSSVSRGFPGPSCSPLPSPIYRKSSLVPSWLIEDGSFVVSRGRTWHLFTHFTFSEYDLLNSEEGNHLLCAWRVKVVVGLSSKTGNKSKIELIDVLSHDNFFFFFSKQRKPIFTLPTSFIHSE